MPEYFDFILRLTVFSLLHSILAIPQVKTRLQKITQRELKGYRLGYNIFACISFAWVMLAWQSTTVLFVAPGTWSLIMHGFQLIILIVAYACLRQTGINRFIGIGASWAEDQKHTLTTSGCYAVVRHPIYLLSILFMLFNPVVTTRWITLGVFSLLYFIAGALLEERRMLRSYGTAYQLYQQRVPFILPRFRSVQGLAASSARE